ncbi:MAG: indole-3-glycerol phosphate synthase TrpC [Muribaculaceae bacterium]|nr:indole-3-glycerol phosphate synthase TrpC [Muribaculaceae bacterium]MDE6642573.1 indole-3-glycerol phosphate synthase TrpC [Muribaculaceae bacterium]
MDSILQKIVDSKRREVLACYIAGVYENLRESGRTPLSFKKALIEGSGIIAEFKRRSPSKGDINPMADVSKIVNGYSLNGASCCSILTDTPFFGGAISDLIVARKVAPSTPLLRKEFIIDANQIREAAAWGADAVLLIASVLDKDEMNSFTTVAHDLGLEVLCELHSVEELDKLPVNADMVGINNRNLATFDTDISRSSMIASQLPSSMIKVAESGIRTLAEVKRLRKEGYSGFLIGETFMCQTEPAEALKRFLNE